MKPINRIGIETRWGYRTFELYHGDLTSMQRKVDVLVISAFSKYYLMTPGSLIWALKNELGIDVARLVEKAVLDLRDVFGCWISEPIPRQRFRWVLGVETPFVPQGPSFASSDIEQAIRNLFVMLSILEAQNYQITSIALPLLGAGLQGYEPGQVVGPLLEQALRFLRRSEFLQQILFVEVDRGRAESLNVAMDTALGRSPVVDSGDETTGKIRNAILTLLDEVGAGRGHKAALWVDEMRQLLLEGRIRPAEVGIVARKLVENLIVEISGKIETTELWRQIDSLSEIGVSPWIRSYMHVLRTFGNESAHNKAHANRRPPVITQNDLTVSLACIERLVSFWIDWKR